MEAGQLRKVLRMVYDGLERRVEPYSLTYKIRKDRVGREYFYGWDRTAEEVVILPSKCTQQIKYNLLIWQMKHLNRFTIELSRAGELSGQTYFGKPFSNITPFRTPRSRKIRSFSSILYDSMFDMFEKV